MDLPQGDIRTPVAGDEHGEINFGCDGHGAAPPSVASGVPESAAYVTRAGAFGPTGCGELPSCGVSSSGCVRVQLRKRIRLEQRGLAMRIGRISTQMNPDKF